MTNGFGLKDLQHQGANKNRRTHGKDKISNTLTAVKHCCNTKITRKKILCVHRDALTVVKHCKKRFNCSKTLLQNQNMRQSCQVPEMAELSSLKKYGQVIFSFPSTKKILNVSVYLTSHTHPQFLEKELYILKSSFSTFFFSW